MFERQIEKLRGNSVTIASGNLESRKLRANPLSKSEPVFKRLINFFGQFHLFLFFYFARCLERQAFRYH